jgi:two-component system phosphate regulon response regulator OmpR
MSAAGTILVVDDDAAVREMLVEYLSSHGFDVMQVDSGESMRAALSQRVPEVVLLDLNLPGEDGLSLARYLREHHDVGIIMVTAAGETVDRIVGLEVGADDYVAKPFDPRELRARVKSVLRRVRTRATEATAAPAASAAQRLSIGPCALDLATHQLYDASGDEIAITAMEFDLLRVFVEHPNQVLSRDQLLTLTRNRDWEPFDRSIDIRIARLRKKLEADPDKPQIIRTVRGTGYMFVPR